MALLERCAYGFGRKTRIVETSRKAELKTERKRDLKMDVSNKDLGERI